MRVLYTNRGRNAEAEERLKRALELFRGLDTRWQTGRTLFELGELSQAQGDSARARERLTLALSAFEEMKAAPDAARTRAMLEAIA